MNRMAEFPVTQRSADLAARPVSRVGRIVALAAIVIVAATVSLGSAKPALAASAITVNTGQTECRWRFDQAGRPYNREIIAWTTTAHSASMTGTPRWTATFQYSPNGTTWTTWKAQSRTGFITAGPSGFQADFGYGQLAVSVAPTNKLFFWRVLNRIDWIGTNVAAPANATQGYLDSGRITMYQHYVSLGMGQYRLMNEYHSRSVCLA